MVGFSTMAFNITAHAVAERFVGIREVPGSADSPAILAMLKLDGDWPQSDEVPWCSAFVNYVCWLLRLPRSKDLRARSWLGVGRVISLDEAVSGFDVVVLTRAGAPKDPNMLDAAGHVGFFAGKTKDGVHLLGGNQGNMVRVATYPTADVLGVRRLFG